MVLRKWSTPFHNKKVHARKQACFLKQIVHVNTWASYSTTYPTSKTQSRLLRCIYTVNVVPSHLLVHALTTNKNIKNTNTNDSSIPQEGPLVPHSPDCVWSLRTKAYIFHKAYTSKGVRLTLIIYDPAAWSYTLKVLECSSTPAIFISAVKNNVVSTRANLCAMFTLARDYPKKAQQWDIIQLTYINDNVGGTAIEASSNTATMFLSKYLCLLLSTEQVCINRLVILHNQQHTLHYMTWLAHQLSPCKSWTNKR